MLSFLEMEHTRNRLMLALGQGVVDGTSASSPNELREAMLRLSNELRSLLEPAQEPPGLDMSAGTAASVQQKCTDTSSTQTDIEVMDVKGTLLDSDTKRQINRETFCNTVEECQKHRRPGPGYCGPLPPGAFTAVREENRECYCALLDIHGGPCVLAGRAVAERWFSKYGLGGSVQGPKFYSSLEKAINGLVYHLQLHHHHATNCVFEIPVLFY